jgi:glycosyltransferase involved in cell wall biosynthesis
MLVGDGPLRQSLETQAAALGIRNRLILTGPVPHVEMPAYLSAMDICVVPHSNAYRSPIKLFEYMARARAVVAPRTEPIALIVRHGENGLLFDSEDPSDLRAQLIALLNDAALRSRLGEEARRDVTQKYTWTENARKLLSKVE